MSQSKNRHFLQIGVLLCLFRQKQNSKHNSNAGIYGRLCSDMRGAEIVLPVSLSSPLFYCKLILLSINQ